MGGSTMSYTPETDELKEDIWATPYVDGQDFDLMVDHARKLERERDEAREIARELRDAMGKLVALNTAMKSDDCTYERAYYSYYKGQYDKWESAAAALTKAKEVLP